MTIDTGDWTRQNHWSWRSDKFGNMLSIKPTWRRAQKAYYLRLYGHGLTSSTRSWNNLAILSHNKIDGDNYYSYNPTGSVVGEQEFRDIEFRAEKLMASGKLDEWISGHPQEGNYDESITNLLATLRAEH